MSKSYRRRRKAPVGATCANVMACREVAREVVLIDIKEGLSEGKMLDMYQCSTLMVSTRSS